MTKNRSAILFLILLSLALVAMADLALGEATGTDQAASAPVPPPPPHPARPHHPPKDLKFVDGHWTPYDPPKVPEGANAYTIVPGDTLWDLSGKFLGNTWLWPQLWDNNRYIRDSHWIYPGDPLLIPAAPTVVPPPGEAAPVAAGEEEEAAAAAAEETAAFERPGPLADKEDLYCSSYIDEKYENPPARISAFDEDKRVQLGEGDVLYMDRGSQDGVSVGDEFDVIRAARDVAHPETGQTVGTLVRRKGRVRVIAIQPTTATAAIVYSCIDIVQGDRLVPKWDPEVPTGFPAPPMQRYGTPPSGKGEGYVLATEYEMSTVGQGDVIQVDVGAQAGLRPGDMLSVFRPNEAGPAYERKLLGTGLVLTVRPASSAVKLTESAREILVGDRVEIQ